MDILQVFRVPITGWIVGVFFVEGAIAQAASEDIRHDLSDSSYFLYQQSDHPKDCKEVSDQCPWTNSSGVHYIRPEGYAGPFEAYCDDGEESSESSEWTVIQTRHVEGSIDFGRDWESYKKGFGFPSQEIWIGNEKLSFLTNQKDYQLLIEMTTANGTIFSFLYNNFRIGDEYSNYRLISITLDSDNAHITWPKTDCQDLYVAGNRGNGIYTIHPTTWQGSPFEVYCNMSDDGGWTVFQRRVDGTVDFYRDWASYKAGVGNMTSEFWLGNDKLYYLTNQRSYQMRIDFVNAYGAPYYVEYSAFRITNETDNYRLVLGDFSGTANNDAFSVHRDQPFTTKDRDNDAYSSNCAVNHHGAWWYNRCHHSNLNGDYHNSGSNGFRWYGLPGKHHDIKYTEMKIRPA